MPTRPASAVACGFGEALGEPDGLADGDADLLGEADTETDGVALAESDGDGEALAESDGVGLSVGDAIGVSDGEALTEGAGDEIVGSGVGTELGVQAGAVAVAELEHPAVSISSALARAREVRFMMRPTLTPIAPNAGSDAALGTIRMQGRVVATTGRGCAARGPRPRLIT